MILREKNSVKSRNKNRNEKTDITDINIHLIIVYENYANYIRDYEIRTIQTKIRIDDERWRKVGVSEVMSIIVQNFAHVYAKKGRLEG